ncbi:hypothetical protein HanIR_Chr04g0155591 [Helianthus annuus]|nr:hypothetical protein HanIR_Chr04g0155591 [Helianthus annuus]
MIFFFYSHSVSNIFGHIFQETKQEQAVRGYSRTCGKPHRSFILVNRSLVAVKRLKDPNLSGE